MRLVRVLGVLVFASGCLDPLVDDTPGYSVHILPPETEVPSVADDPGLRLQIDRGDGIGEMGVARRAAWAKGQQVYYWDFGVAPRFAIPIWSFRRCDADGVPLNGAEGMTGHPSLIEAVPGDVQYSPFWAIYTVCVTDAWSGERIVSLEALADAVELGLVASPTPSGNWFNCPVVLPDTAIDVGTGFMAIVPRPVYYRGRTAHFLSFGGPTGTQALARGRVVPQSYVYFLSKRGDDDYEEVIFGHARQTGAMIAMGYSPLVRVVHVRMAADYVAGTLRDASELVARDGDQFTAVHPMVERIEPTDELRNLEIQFVPENGN